MKFALRRATSDQVKGIKIQVSGRLNGAEIARTEWLRKGRVPLQTLRARVDYTHTTAQTKYGLLGIKVWIFEGLADKGIELGRKRKKGGHRLTSSSPIPISIPFLSPSPLGKGMGKGCKRP
jgi:ribosomal protein S3